MELISRKNSLISEAEDNYGKNEFGKKLQNSQKVKI